MRIRTGRPYNPVYPDSKTGKLDERILVLLAQLAVSANKCDSSAYLHRFRDLAENYSLASHRLAGFYASFLLKHELNAAIGLEPSTEETDELAKRLRPRFHLVLPNESDLLESLITAAYERGLDERLAGGLYTYCSIVALGVMWDEPVRQLEEARPHLETWCARGAEFIRRACEAPERIVGR